MKIKPEDYQYMLSKIRPLAPQIPELRDDILRTGKYKDLDKRIRWDLCYKAGLIPWICDHLYPHGINDDHVDTALRRIMKEITNGTDTSTAS